MADSCCPGNSTAVSAVPTISTCSNGGCIRNAICLPSSCRCRTWQLVTHQENRQGPDSAPVSSESVSRPSTCFPETSCVGFVCQPIGSDTGGTPHPAASHQPSCMESAGCHMMCYENSSCLQNSGQGSACTSGSCQTACGPSASCDDGACQPSCSEATSCAETLCQPTSCQGGSRQPTKGEGQLCQSVYYQPICYVLKSCQPAPFMPVSCQPLTCMCSCSQICCAPSPCQPFHCQTMPIVSFICQPVAPCQSPCFVNSSSVSASCVMISGQPICGGPTPDQSGCQSPSYQPPCCVTGLGKPSSSGPGCCLSTCPDISQAGTCGPTS